MKPLRWALNPTWQVSLGEEETPGMCTHNEKAMWEYSIKVVIYKSKREASGETKHAENFDLALLASRIVRK